MKLINASSFNENTLFFKNLAGFKVINRHLKRWCRRNNIIIGYKDGYHTIDLLDYYIYEDKYLKGENK